MPRLSWRVLSRAWKEDPLLPKLLRSCRDLRSARLELKWLKEHAQTQASRNIERRSWQSLLARYCKKRSLGTPLQYILGTEFFGELELKCRPGVLIPRQDTAAYVQHLAGLLSGNASRLPIKLKVLDLCTGSGCIPLLFAHQFSARRNGHTTEIEVLGVDISENAISLAETNKREQIALHPPSQISHVDFICANILDSATRTTTPPLSDVLRDRGQLEWDILISNPPYISPRQYRSVTARSVRKFEPKLALVPTATASRNMSDDEHGDLFYPRLLEIAEQLNIKLMLMEVGDMEQARRVAKYVIDLQRWDGVEIWCDEPGASDDEHAAADGVQIKGRGHGRSVLCWRSDAGLWISRD